MQKLPKCKRKRTHKMVKGRNFLMMALRVFFLQKRDQYEAALVFQFNFKCVLNLF